MKVGLIDVDSRIPNLALMKLSAWHKAQGDKVKWHDGMYDQPDRIYASKVFKFTSDYVYFPGCEVIRGGSGYDLDTKLPNEIESQNPDYSLYGLDYAMGFTSRGCNRNCGFCIVPRKEGRWHQVADIDQFWQGQKHLMLLDGNLTSDHEHFIQTCRQLIDDKIRTYFSQGLDIRLMDDEKAKILAQVKDWGSKRIHFAWDNIADEEEIRRGIEIVTKFIKPYRIMFYILIGWDTTLEEDLYRVELLRSFGIEPYAMPYDKTDPYQSDFTRWVNVKKTFKNVPWDKYERRN